MKELGFVLIRTILIDGVVCFCFVFLRQSKKRTLSES